ncbi:MAG: hypothetical protein KAV87_02390 [Desulfobacteraceae bacterium]|nr:hypothetical protein [Desulfobacteraceae bacterium]
MAELGVLIFTLEEWAKRLDPKGKVDMIVEILAQTNEVLTDMMMMEGNLPTGHRTTIRTGLPAVTWRKLNYGVLQGKSTTVQVDDTVGMLEAYAEVDKDLADLNGNTAAFRLSEDQAFIEAMNQEMATAFFYHDSSLDPEKPMGMAPRYPYKDGPNVVDFGGTGSDLTSIWFCVWGSQTLFGIFPKGSKVGLVMEDKGQVTIEDSNSRKYEGYRSHYQWKLGFVLKDWRYVVRCCNIESAASTNNLIDKLSLLIKAYNLIPNMNMGRTVMYCNRDMKTQFDTASYNKTSPAIYTDDAGGKPVTKFMGIPIRKCDAILSTESALIATP